MSKKYITICIYIYIIIFYNILGEMGKWGWGYLSPSPSPSPSPFHYISGENGEMGMGWVSPSPSPFQFGDDFHPHPSPFPHFSPKKKSPNGDGDAGNWGPGEKCTSLTERYTYSS